MVIQNPNIIFIHQSKTAGTSITGLLKSVGNMIHHNRIINHHNLQAVVDHGIDIDDYTVVTCLRHPTERIFSYYRMCYAPGFFNYPRQEWGDIFPRTGDVSVQQFVENIHPGLRFLEDLFWYLTVDGELYPNITYLNFHTLQQDIGTLLGKAVELPHRRRSDPKQNTSDPRAQKWYCDTVGRMYEREIRQFF